MTPAEVVEAVRKAGYVGYDRSLHSKCAKPERYGIRPVPEVANIVGPIKPRKKSKRKLNNKFTWRCDNSVCKRLNDAQNALHIETIQQFISLAVIKYIEEVEHDKALD